MDPESAWLISASTACIEFHESTDGQLSPNLFGIEPITWRHELGESGTADEASVSTQQDAAFALWKARGWQPWSSRFVCGLG